MRSLTNYITEITQIADGNELYYKFKTNMSFRYTACYKLYQHGYVVHGSDSEFETFDSSKIKGGSRAVYGWGAYFTNDSYKCEEYGNNFVFLNIKPFKLLELENNISASNDEIAKVINQIETLNAKIQEAEEGLYNAVNIRDYNYYDNERKQCKELLQQLVPDSKTEVFLDMYSNFLKKNSNATYLQLIHYLRNVFQNKMGESFVSLMFLKFGYDGFHIENQFILFNFDKINNNIVKNKNELLRQILQENENTKI